MTYKDLPGTEPDVSYAYDLTGQMTSAATSSQTLSFTYDALGRNLTQVGPQGTLTSTYDLGGRRTRLTHPDGFYVDQDHLVTGDVSAVRQNGATSGVNVLATYAYDDLGRRTSVTRGNGTSSSYGYDAVSRLTSLAHDLAGTSWDATIGLTYNPAGQIVTHSFSNDAYAYTSMGSGSLNYGINGLNQVTAVGATNVTSDARGNLTSDGTNSYTFSSDNRLTGLITGSVTSALGYDPLGRWNKGATYLQLGWDGDDMVIEKINSTATKWMHGAGGEPLVREDPDGTWHWMYLDERGSTIASALNDGTKDWVTTYDEYGRTGTGHGAFRYGYAGQVLIGSGLSFARNRVYALNLGRFVQTDPIGFGGGMNWYGYVGADPINRTDPLGLRACLAGEVLVVYAHVNERRNDGVVNAPPHDCISFDQLAGVTNVEAIYGAPEYGSGDPAPPVQEANRCGAASLAPHGAGISGNLAAEFGIPRLFGASAQASAGGGVFFSDNGASLGAFRSGANVLALGDSSYAQPHQTVTPQVNGASAGGGISVFLTNAQSAEQLSGPFTTWSLNVGYGPAKFSAQFLLGNGIWQASLGPPALGATAGASVSKVTTTTTSTAGCR